ncbi:MAG TPA: HAMP domain-containing sensor histidine kinase [Verrucomicrobiae bacterium]
MPRRFPLYAKILLLFFLNMALLGLLCLIPYRAQFRTGPDWFLPRDASDRIDALSAIILDELSHEPRAQWNGTLHTFDSGYHDKVHFLMFDGHGQQIAGESLTMPVEICQRLAGPPGPPDHHEPRMDRSPEGPRDGALPGPPPDPRPKFMSHTKDPSRYWVIVRPRFEGMEPRHGEPLNLVMVSETLAAGGLFFDAGPWINVGLAAVALSALLWFPLLRGINRSIAQMTQATRQIAEGRFETRVNEARRDELGDLGRAVNQMAGRLAGLVAGQKRFLGDVAHELCSPLAKMRVSLGILDQRASEQQKEYVARAEEEAAHIAGLVNELLSFSKASLTGPPAALRPVNVRETVDKAVRREAQEGAQIQIDVRGDVAVSADAELLTRALANLLRNAVCYAGEAGPITVAARRERDSVFITMSDCGPGVSAADLPRIFDPFYRADTSRDRATGGVGLGLSIVKTCVESCGGTVTCRNLEQGGLEVAMNLQAAKFD